MKAFILGIVIGAILGWGTIKEPSDSENKFYGFLILICLFALMFVAVALK